MKMLGSEAYGVFAVIGLIGNLNVFSNLGLNQALVVHLAEYGKSKIGDYYVITSIILSLSISIPLTIIGLAYRDFIIASIFNIPQNQFEDALVLYTYLIIANNLALLGQVFTAILDSQQKMYITNFYQVINNSIYNGLIIVVLFLHYGLKEIGFAIFLSSTIWILMIAYSSLKRWGKINFQGFTKNFLLIAKQLISLGSKIYFSGMINFFYEPITKIAISNLIGINEVGFFDVVLKLRNQMWGVISRINQPLLPMFSNLNDKTKLRLLVHY